LEMKPDLLSNILNMQNWYLRSTRKMLSVMNLMAKIEFLS